MSETEHAAGRRIALDWLRIGAFALLIFYHIGMFYVSWDWHVKSSRASDAIEPIMLLTNPWRLLLLFLISGVATRYMADKLDRFQAEWEPVGRPESGPTQMSRARSDAKPVSTFAERALGAGALLKSRMARLFPPLLLAVFVIVPPQSYYEIVEKLGYAGGFAAFYANYATASGNWRLEDHLLITPTYNHMWFVAYLIVFTLALAALLPLLRRAPAAMFERFAQGPAVLLLPWLLLWAARATLFPIFGETHAFVDDWYLNTIYFAGFLFGYAIAKHAPFFQTCARQRWLAGGLAIAAFGALTLCREIYAESDPPDWLLFLMRGARELQAWGAVVALIGFAHLHARADGPVRRYLTEAIFPFYIVHQTVIVVAGHHLNKLSLPLWQEAALLTAATLGACILTFEIARRVPVLRPWFGLKPNTRGAALKEAAVGAT